MSTADDSGTAGGRDQAIETTEQAQQSKSRAAQLFDVRLVIGALFAVYGIVLLIAGLTDSKAKIAQAVGVRINLWSGIVMLIVGALFILWSRLRPVEIGAVSEEAADLRPDEMESRRTTD